MYGGTKEEMARLLKDAEKLTGQKYDMSNFADIVDAIHAIQVQMDVAGTTAKEASTTISGSWNSTKAAWENLLVAMADPKGNIKKATKNLVSSAKTTLANVLPIVRQTISGLGDFVAEVAPMIGETIPELVTEFVPKFLKAGKDLAVGLGKGLVAGVKKLKWPTWKDVRQFATNAWKKVQSGVEELGGLVFGKKEDGTVNWPNWESIKKFAADKWKEIVDSVKALPGLIFGKKEDGTVNWPDWETIKQTATDLWNDLLAVTDDLGGLIFGKNEEGKVNWPTLADLRKTGLELWMKVVGWANDLGGLIFGKNKNGEVNWPDFETLKSAADGLWEKLKGYVATLGGLVFGTNEDGTVNWPDITKLSADFATWWTETAVPALQGAMSWTLQLFGMPKESADTISSLIGSWWSTIVDVAQGALVWALGLPDTPPNEAGKQLRALVAKWWNGIKSLVQGALKWLLGIPDMEDENGVSTKEKIVTWWTEKVVPILTDALDFVLGLFDLPPFSDMVKKIEDWWEDVKKDVSLALVASIFPKLQFGGQQYEYNPGGEGTSLNEAIGASVQNDPILPKANVEDQQWYIDMMNGLDDSNAKGLWNVPYDNYTSRLHRGEMVLTASRARDYREGIESQSLGNGAVVDAINELRTALSNLSIQVAGKEFGRATVRYGGGMMNGYLGSSNRAKMTGYGTR